MAAGTADGGACNAETYNPDSPEPELLDVREQVMNPYTAYQITSMMAGVVERGTGRICGQRPRGLAFAGDIAAADSSALDDPFVGRVDLLRKLRIGDAARRKR